MRHHERSWRAQSRAKNYANENRYAQQTEREKKKEKTKRGRKKKIIKIPLPRANDKCANDGVYDSSVTEQGFPSGGFFFAVKVFASAYCRIIIQLYTSGGWPRALM